MVKLRGKFNIMEDYFMKRIIALFVSIVLVCACFAIQASAEGSYSLIPSEDKADGWNLTACQGYNIDIQYTDEAVVFSAESVWPCADFTYAAEDQITVSVEDYSLVYDFTVASGATNINFTFGSSVFSIANNSLGDVFYDSGSGDLLSADYKGAIKLTDFVNSTMFLGGTTFPQSAIVDGKITFTAIQVYSVSGATVTIRDLSLVPNDEVPEEPEESSEVIEESSEVIAESSEVIVESDAASEATSEAASETVSETASETVSADEPAEEDGLGIWLWVIIGAAAIVIVIVIVVVAKKKK
jgi:hypothetical protein